MKIKIHKKDIAKISDLLLKKVSKTKTNKAKIIAMFGNLGAGKTTLTQQIAKDLGIKSSVSSPTFVIMKIYKVNSSSIFFKYFKKLIHIDAYRLDNSKDLEKIGWGDLYEDKENLIIIEWPENVKDCLDFKTHFVYLKHDTEETRILEF